MSQDTPAWASDYRAGFISIIGKPNVGKSTLMNALVGDKLSIISPRAQTTRHRIFGILTGENFQAVFSDTPGVLTPKYELHNSMRRFIESSLEDADLVLLVVDRETPWEEVELMERLTRLDCPIYLVVNKVDLCQGDEAARIAQAWQERVPVKTVLEVSALKKIGTQALLDTLLTALPQHPPYFPPDELSDRPERFFAAEIIREKIFELYREEVPYSCEVQIADFKAKDDMEVIRAEILVERTSQRAILIGNKGAAIKKLGIRARAELESFFGRKVFLETHVKVVPDWRQKSTALRSFGY